MKWDVQFPGDLILRHIPGRGVHFSLYAPFPWILNGVPYTVEKDFSTDGASIPQVGQGVISNDDGVCLRAAIPHDKGYSCRGVMTDDAGSVRVFTREEMDEILRDGMETCGASLLEREAFFLAVRAGGWVPWNRYVSPLAMADPDNSAMILDADRVDAAILAAHGLSRSPHWPEFSREVIAQDGACQFCGGVKLLQVHHIKPFHLFPALELDRRNVITLCMAPGNECHFVQGHKRNWLKFEPNIREICQHRKHQLQPA